MVIMIMWLCLITVSQLVDSKDSKMIVVNNSGNSSEWCCKFGNCICGSFYNALLFIENNTVISIASSTVQLNDPVNIERLSNIRITSSEGAMVMCNDTGYLFCNVCSNVIVEAITWDQCGSINVSLQAGIGFLNAVSNISIFNCTFQYFKVCSVVYIEVPVGTVYVVNVYVVNSKFMFNAISNPSLCGNNYYSTFQVRSFGNAEINIYNSLFYNNGNSNQGSTPINGSLFIVCSASHALSQVISVKNSNFISYGIGGIFINNPIAMYSIFTFDRVNVSGNWFGMNVSVQGEMNVISSYFTHNSNGALFAKISKSPKIELYSTIFAHNNATASVPAAALYVLTESAINISQCIFYENVGGNSIVYVSVDPLFSQFFPLVSCSVAINSSNFTSNSIGSALQIADCFLNFYSTTVFQNNTAKSGAAIYIAKTSQITVDDASSVHFVNNTASLYGGAMYIDLTKCYNHGVVFIQFTRYDVVSFIGNSARVSGNSIYFNIPSSCKVIRDITSNDSAAYVPYKFSYNQSSNIVGPAITTSPYELNLCSAKCNSTYHSSNSRCAIEKAAMLGQPIYFKTALCDYFNTVAEATKFQVKCINCSCKYKPLDNEVLIHDSNVRINLLSVNGSEDLKNFTNVTLNILSRLSQEYKQITAKLSLTLFPCFNGFVFNKASQQCECFKRDKYLHCEGDSVSIKLGYWFGVFSGRNTFSVCENKYCNFFTNRKETRSGFYNLPEETDDQCSSHRTGVACGQCSEGYTLAYNSADCISVDKCSVGITVLVVVLNALYWIIIVGILFGIGYVFNAQQIPPGYLYGIIYFYSIVDILLVTNLRITDGVFYTATTLSSFAKLNPQFLGMLCFIKNLDAIDQQFIHYCHAMFVSVIMIAIYLTAKCNNRVLMYANHAIGEVVFLVILLSYTSLTSTSLLLLRAIKFDGIDGLYTYLSPSIKYFTEQHAVYGSVAILYGLLITVGFPFLLVVEPFLLVVVQFIVKKFDKPLNNNTRKERIIMFMYTSYLKIKPLLDRFQGCYKDQYRWFAAYYLICRLVIMLITYFANNDYGTMIYYLQTTCVIVAMTHIWIKPYKNDVHNVIDGVILLIMPLIVNLSVYGFSTSVTAGVAIGLIITPALLLFGVGVKKLIVSKVKRGQQPNPDDDFRHSVR